MKCVPLYLSLAVAVGGCLEADPPPPSSPAVAAVARALDDADALDANDLEARGSELGRAARALAAVEPTDIDVDRLAALTARHEAMAGAHARALAAEPGFEAPRAERLPFAAGGVLALGEPCLGKDEPLDGFGGALAFGDFDGDGELDLAVGAGGEYLGDAISTGVVYVFRGVAGELEPWFQLRQTGLGATESFDFFGYSLAAGDVDGDGDDELVVGASGEDLGSTQDAGYVFVFRGGPGGLQPWHGLSQTGIGSNEAGDRFGVELVMGDFNGNGRADLVVSAPFERAYGKQATGYLFVFQGSTSGLSAWHGLHYRDVLGAPLTFSRLGLALAVGDIDGDGRADIVARTSENDSAGAVYSFTSQASHLVPDQRMSQEDFPGHSSASADAFGESLLLEDVNGDGWDDLVVGAPGDDSLATNAGRVFVYAGLPNRQLNSSMTIAGTSAASERRFGRALAGGNFNGAGPGDLVITGDTAGPWFYRGGASGPTFWFLDSDPSAGMLAAGDVNGDGATDLAVERNIPTSVDRVDILMGGPTSLVSAGELSQQAPGCEPTWPAPPSIQLLGAFSNQMTLRFTGDAGTHSITSGRSSFGAQETASGNDVVRTFHLLAPSTQYCFYAWATGASLEASDISEACFTTSN